MLINRNFIGHYCKHRSEPSDILENNQEFLNFLQGGHKFLKILRETHGGNTPPDPTHNYKELVKSRRKLNAGRSKQELYGKT